MPQHSTLARLQQCITIALLAGAGAWLAHHWQASPLRALAGFAAIAFAYSAFLAVEFVILGFVSRTDTTPAPTVAELAGAWLGETLAAPAVFCWRQPFRWRAEPDFLPPQVHGRRGAVFIHGFVCNRGFWTPWLRALRERGHGFAAVNLEPVFGPIERYVPLIDDAVRRVTQATGLAPVLVCHSMGGLAARAWLREGGAGRAHHVITIGTPHRGTWLARFSHLANGRQMRVGGDWLGGLHRHEAQAGPVPFTCWYSNCDNIVFPTSTATLPGADNRLVRGVAHVQLGFDPRVVDASLKIVAGR